MKTSMKKILAVLLSAILVLSLSSTALLASAENGDYTGGEVNPLACTHTPGETWQSDAENHWHICSECEQPVDTAAHTYIWREVKEATETENGLKKEVCSVCGYESGNSEEIVYNSHIPGDINKDGSVNNKDLTRLFQYLSDWDVEVDEEALDVNDDGWVNNKDLTRLFQFLSDWDVDIH